MAFGQGHDQTAYLCPGTLQQPNGGQGTGSGIDDIIDQQHPLPLGRKSSGQIDRRCCLAYPALLVCDYKEPIFGWFWHRLFKAAGADDLWCFT